MRGLFPCHARPPDHSPEATAVHLRLVHSDRHGRRRPTIHDFLPLRLQAVPGTLCVGVTAGLRQRPRQKTRGWSAFATAVRFNLVDGVHGIDSSGVQAFCDELDTEEDQRHAALQ